MKELLLENKEFIDKIVRNNRYISFMDHEMKSSIACELTAYEIENKVMDLSDKINFIFDNPIKDILRIIYQDSCIERHLISKNIKESKLFHLKNFTNHI